MGDARRKRMLLKSFPPVEVPKPAELESVPPRKTSSALILALLALGENPLPDLVK